jgi:hypothetical protein
MRELAAISSYYGDKRAERSGVLLMNHITEGLVILDEVGASEWAKRAFCLHPIVQEDEALGENFDWLQKFHPWVVALAMEYRWVANCYLSSHPNQPVQEIYLSPLADVNDMLIADKVQNYKDFLIYHLETHPNASRLDQYFRQWLERLGISKDRFKELGKLLKEVGRPQADD